MAAVSGAATLLKGSVVTRFHRPETVAADPVLSPALAGVWAWKGIWVQATRASRLIDSVFIRQSLSASPSCDFGIRNIHIQKWSPLFLLISSCVNHSLLHLKLQDNRVYLFFLDENSPYLYLEGTASSVNRQRCFRLVFGLDVLFWAF